SDNTACALLWGWCDYLRGRYAEAQRWLDISLAVAPEDFDPMVATPLRINVALGRGDVALALELARTVTATGELSVRPAELATAVGAAYAWAGLAAEARDVLGLAAVRATQERRLTAHTMSLVSMAIIELEDGDVATAHGAAVTALSTAQAFGLAGYHGVAPAFAVRARTSPDPQQAHDDALHSVELARRATTDLGRAFVFTTAGATLLGLGDDSGLALITEARAIIDRCVDPGVAGSTLRRAEGKFDVVRPAMAPRPELVEQLTDRERSVLLLLPSQMTLREIAAELYVSLNTAKTHCSAIYRKLGVTDRKSAVQEARRVRVL
ncbi:MAG: helix-turn-helix transcriptional regulator, partial [Actinomycetota bacterium]